MKIRQQNKAILRGKCERVFNSLKSLNPIEDYPRHVSRFPELYF